MELRPVSVGVVKILVSCDNRLRQGRTKPDEALWAKDPEGNALQFLWWQQPEIGTAKVAIDDAGKSIVNVRIPADAAGERLHLVCEVSDNGLFSLKSYQRIIIISL